MRVAGLYARDDAAARRQWRTRFLIVLSVIPPVCYWFIESPVQMVLMGGIAQAAMLPLIGIAAIYLRHKHVPKDIQPTAPTTVMLWIATAVMAGFALYYAPRSCADSPSTPTTSNTNSLP